MAEIGIGNMHWPRQQWNGYCVLINSEQCHRNEWPNVMDEQEKRHLSLLGVPSSNRWKLAASALAHLMAHAVICYGFSVFLGWVEMKIHVAQRGSHYVNEFVGRVVVMAIYFTGPISCSLAAPFHLFAFCRKAGVQRHVFSVLASILSSFVVAFALFALTTS